MKKLFTLFLTCTGLTVYSQLIVATGSVAYAKLQHQSQMISNGKVVAFGGNNANASSYVVYNNSEIYNPATGTWSATGNLLRARTHHASVLLSNGNILAMAGKTVNGDKIASCEIYNTTAGTWSYTDSLPAAQSDGKALVLNNTNVLYVGGVGSTDCYLYNQTSNTWTTTGSLTTSRQNGFSLVKLADGRVLAAGGNSQTSAEIYDPSTGIWTLTTGNMSVNHNFNQSILLSNNKVLIAGGDGTKVSEVFDPATGLFTTAGNMLQYASGCPMITLTNGRILIFGIGNLFNPTDKQCLQVFNPTTNSWYSAGIVGSSIFGASGYTVHKLQTGKVLFVAGNFTTGNGASAYCYLVTESSIAASVESLSNVLSIDIYPNPSNAKITVNMELKQEEEMSIVIKNLIGQPIMGFKDESAGNLFKKEIDLSALSGGIYFITIQMGAENITKRIIKN